MTKDEMEPRKLTEEEILPICAKLLDCMHYAGYHTREYRNHHILFWRGASIYWMMFKGGILVWGLGKDNDNPFDTVETGQDLPMDAEGILTAELPTLAQCLEETVIKIDIAQYQSIRTQGSFWPAGTDEVLTNWEEPGRPPLQPATEQGGRALSAKSFHPERSHLNTDVQALEQRFMELMGEAGFDVQLHTDVVEPRSRLRAPFDEVWYWKDDDICYAQFGRLDGSGIILGFFAQICHTAELWLYRTFHSTVHIYDLLTSPDYRQYIPHIVRCWDYPYCKVAATEQVLSSPAVY